MTVSENAAQRALDIINNLGGVVSEFRDNWLAVQAYSTAYENGGDQRSTIVDAIEGSLSEEVCQTILAKFESDIQYLHSSPVGDLRYGNGDEKFYRNGNRDIQLVINKDNSSQVRLANLLCVVYQIRCNLDHGHKELTTTRSQKLFDIGNRIILAVIESLLPISKAS
ncbi:hypothetical protein [Aliivibrio fischeri]|uniref:hypothetical protein n=1 Tax=Aliivibrio fischeri TaxID=668 RepID=UPI00080E6EA3|nr:hypothetical protein [Aliivibrio fischeri]OCH02716.1 hypothetical protein A6E09_18525 [Aliivibrio fischeri]